MNIKRTLIKATKGRIHIAIVKKTFDATLIAIYHEIYVVTYNQTRIATWRATEDAANDFFG